MAIPAKLLNKKFGRLKVLGREGTDNHGKAVWLCLCDCGETAYVTSGDLNSGHTKSCGCLHKQVAKSSSTIHGHAGKCGVTPTYISWYGMIQRCTNSNNKDYKYYGGRGISVCASWKTFLGFFTDMGVRPKGKTIDRIESDGNYEPDNCRWATYRQQSANRRCAA